MRGAAPQFAKRQTMASAAPKRWTILEVIQWTTGFLAGRGVQEARLDAELMLSHVLGCPRIALYTGFDKVLDPEQLAAYRKLIEQRGRRVPVEYLLGRTEFMGLEFAVDRRVLIPRHETEFVVEAILERCRERKDAPITILDLGAGSGNIAVSLAKRLERATVYACDLSQAALDVASENAKRHGVANRVHFRHGDLFGAFSGDSLAGKADFVASNPPYLSDADWQAAPPEVREHEPREALLAGENGLAFHRRILADSPAFLAPGGWLALELGAGQAPAVRQLAEATTAFDKVDTLKDYQGIERVLVAQRER
ncbi:MAG: peptide chain release factor N(5)-glutamine methyltransferase [Planctomycetes bacterium]|nr:peptide chain release factor N(5)-glutamine methyltransferase [Planctomycetota bacterium]